VGEQEKKKRDVINGLATKKKSCHFKWGKLGNCWRLYLEGVNSFGVGKDPFRKFVGARIFRGTRTWRKKPKKDSWNEKEGKRCPQVPLNEQFSYPAPKKKEAGKTKQ